MTKIKPKYVLFFVAFLCIFIRVIFVMGSGILEPGMQNDIGSLNENCFGHLGYIYYLANGGDIIYNGADVHYQFYHPPLHYMISALWLKVGMGFGLSLLAAGESLQILTCIYSALTLFFLDKLTAKLGGNIKERIAVLCFAGFFPYAVFMAGSINNDSLSLLLMVMTGYFLVLYYEKATIKNALLLGVCFGLAIMTKISALILGPGIAFLLLYQLQKKKNRRGTLWGMDVVIAICSGVLGLWYPVKNYVIYDMDLLYIPRLELDSEQYIGQFSGISRFFDFDPKQMVTLGLVFNEEKGMLDHNIFLSLLKYSVFAESEYYLAAEFVSRILLYVFATLWIVIMGAAVFSLFRARWKREYKITMTLFCAANIYSYLRFCFTHPHVCTMHVRYIMVSVLFLMMTAGFFAGRKKKTGRIWSGVILVYVMTTLSFVAIFFGNLYGLQL